MLDKVLYEGVLGTSHTFCCGSGACQAIQGLVQFRDAYSYGLWRKPKP